MDRFGWTLAALGVVGWILAPRALILWAFLIMFGVVTVPQQIARWWKARKEHRPRR